MEIEIREEGAWAYQNNGENIVEPRHDDQTFSGVS